MKDLGDDQTVLVVEGTWDVGMCRAQIGRVLNACRHGRACSPFGGVEVSYEVSVFLCDVEWRVFLSCELTEGGGISCVFRGSKRPRLCRPDF